MAVSQQLWSNGSDKVSESLLYVSLCCTEYELWHVPKDGWAVDLQAEPYIRRGEEAARPAQGPVADPQTHGCKSDEGPRGSQEPAGVQQKSGRAGGVD